MAKTTQSTSAALTKKLWEEQLFRDTKKEAYISKFMSKGSDSLVHEKDKLTKEKGDNISFGIRMRLAGAGVISNQTLEGNEEPLQTYDFNVSLEEYAHAVRDAGPLDRQRPVWDMDAEAKQALQDWMAEKIDELGFDGIIGTSSSNYATRIFYRTSGGNTTTATAATAHGALEASNSKLTPSLLDYAKVWAMTGGNRAQTPLRPVKIGGKKYFAFLGHPDCFYDLRQDSTWMQSVREALPRGESNPIFNGAFGVWNGMVLHEHENVPIFTDGGSGGNVPGARCVLLGAQSLTWAWGARPKVNAQQFDYDREHGFAISMMAGVGKPKFNSLDYGSVGIYVSRTQISDAS